MAKSTVAEKITKEDLHLDWAQPAEQLHRVVRLEHAWTTFRGKRLGVLEAPMAPAAVPSQQRSAGHPVGSAVVDRRGDSRVATRATREPFPHVSRRVAPRRAACGK